MTNYQIAGEIVPSALRGANAIAGAPLGEGTLIPLAAALSTAVSTYGIQNKRAVTKAAVKITPDFKQIAKPFFQTVQETLNISKSTYSKDYEEIADFISQNQDLSAKERLKLYAELNEKRSAKVLNFLKTFCGAVILLSLLAGIGIYFLVPEVHEKVNSFFGKVGKIFGKIGKRVQKLIRIIGVVANEIRN